jgi:hypothetical protein
VLDGVFEDEHGRYPAGRCLCAIPPAAATAGRGTASRTSSSIVLQPFGFGPRRLCKAEVRSNPSSAGKSRYQN